MTKILTSTPFRLAARRPVVWTEKAIVTRERVLPWRVERILRVVPVARVASFGASREPVDKDVDGLFSRAA